MTLRRRLAVALEQIRGAVRAARRIADRLVEALAASPTVADLPALLAVAVAFP